MKIALIGQKGLPAWHGGVERHVEQLSLRLARLGHTVDVYSRTWYSKTKDKMVDGVNLIHAPSIKSKHLDTITHTFLATLKACKSRPDIIHFHGVGPALLSWLPRILARQTKVVVTFHSIDRYHKKWNKIARYFLRLGEYAACAFPNQTITISQSLQEYCRNEFYKETAYIPNGVTINPQPTDPKLLAPFNLEPKKYITMISRLVPHKGTHILIDAFLELKKSGGANEKIKDLKLAIVGGSARTDKYVAELTAQAKNHPDIIFTDTQSGPTLASLYGQALALVHPSFNEGLPTTVIEAMSYGTPVIVSQIPEHRELITDPRLLFMVNDVPSLTTRLQEFLQMSENDRQSVIAKNLESVAQKYDWDELVKQVENVYKLLLSPTISSNPSKSTSSDDTSIPGLSRVA